MPLPMILILALLTLIVTFGVGFILNMIIKRWWVSSTIYLVCILYILYRTGFQLNILYWILLVLGAFSVIGAGLGFRKLQKQGYSMFQHKELIQEK